MIICRYVWLDHKDCGNEVFTCAVGSCLFECGVCHGPLGTQNFNIKHYSLQTSKWRLYFPNEQNAIPSFFIILCDFLPPRRLCVRGLGEGAKRWRQSRKTGFVSLSNNSNFVPA